jgi:hypothetical protein
MPSSNDREHAKSYDIELLLKGNREFNENQIEVDERCLATLHDRRKHEIQYTHWRFRTNTSLK